MSVQVRKVTTAVQKQLDACPTTVARIRLLTTLDWSTGDIARKLGTIYQHVWNEQHRAVKNPKK